MIAICSAHKKRTDLKNLCAFVIVLFFSSKRSKSSRWAARAFRSSVKPEALKRTYQTVRWSRSQGTALVLVTKSQKTRGPTGSCIIPQIIIISSITL